MKNHTRNTLSIQMASILTLNYCIQEMLCPSYKYMQKTNRNSKWNITWYKNLHLDNVCNSQIMIRIQEYSTVIFNNFQIISDLNTSKVSNLWIDFHFHRLEWSHPGLQGWCSAWRSKWFSSRKNNWTIARFKSCQTNDALHVGQSKQRGY